MIYFDNAATTLKKPQSVIDAVTFALTSYGNSGRGAYKSALDSEINTNYLITCVIPTAAWDPFLHENL